MKTYLSILFCLLPLLAQADNPLPKNFTINEDVTFFQATMSVVNSDNNKMGTISKDVLSLTTNFTYKAGDTVQARAEESFLSWGHQSKITDGQGHFLGTIKEELFTSFFRSFNQYTIFNATGQAIGTSQRQSLFATDITISDAQGNVLATINRPAFTIMDTWSVHVNSSVLDPRLILFIAAYKTDSDNHKH